MAEPRRVELFEIAALRKPVALVRDQGTGGRFHPRLDISESPIEYKYREGKMQRTLKGEFKVLEIVQRETIVAVSSFFGPAPKLNLGARLPSTGRRRPDELFGPWPTSVAFVRGRKTRGTLRRGSDPVSTVAARGSLRQ